MREVKRKAKVGEYIKIVDKYGNDKSYKNGDILKIVDDCLIGCWVETPTDNHVAIFDKEYVVLEDYNPNEFHVGDRVQIKSWEEMEKEFGNGNTITITPDGISFSTPIMKDCFKISNENFAINGDVCACKNNNKEEKEMNKVLELYNNRKETEIREETTRKAREEYESIEIVKQYIELVETFNKNMEDLYTSDDNKNNKYITENPICSLRYDLNNTSEYDIRMKYQEEEKEKLKELHKLVEEVEAQLSLSNGLDYQINVLETYGIIDKKTNKLVD